MPSVKNPKADPGIACAYSKLLAPAALKPHPRNPNEHPPAQVALFLRLIRAHQWRRPIVVSNRSGCIVRGHGAHLAATLGKFSQVPVEYQDYPSDEAELQDLVADNELARLSHSNETILESILKDLDEKGFDRELAGILAEIDAEPPAVPDASLQRMKALRKKWKCARGQLWEIGAHRLLCGDSTNEKDVQRLLTGKPVLMVTDPPYGVSYDPKWRIDWDGSSRHALGKVANDDRVDWTPAFRLGAADVAYVWHAGKYAEEVARNLAACDFEIVCQLIWVKPHFVLSRGDYHWGHEPAWYAVKKNAKHNWHGARDQSTVWQIQTRNGFIEEPGEKQTGHATQKPVECMARPIRNNSAEGDLIYDPFCGSGTTLCACEQLKRRGFGMEIDPEYVAVTLERLAEMGLKPKLLS